MPLAVYPAAAGKAQMHLLAGAGDADIGKSPLFLEAERRRRLRAMAKSDVPTALARTGGRSIERDNVRLEKASSISLVPG